MDLDGDGVVDALRTAAGAFDLYFNHPPAGWDEVRQVQRGPLEEFPDVSSPTTSVAELTVVNCGRGLRRHRGNWPWPSWGAGRSTAAFFMPLPGAAGVFGARFDPSGCSSATWTATASTILCTWATPR